MLNRVTPTFCYSKNNHIHNASIDNQLWQQVTLKSLSKRCKRHLCNMCLANTLTAIKLLLTEPRPRSALLKCSITSQLDFFGVVVAAALVSELITGDCNVGTCNSSEICGDRDCRNDVERRVIPLRDPTSFSCFNENGYQIPKHKNKHKIWIKAPIQRGFNMVGKLSLISQWPEAFGMFKKWHFLLPWKYLFRSGIASQR